MTNEAFKFLCDIVPFSFLPKDLLKDVARELDMTAYPKETVLFVQGQSRIDRLYIFFEGAAERYYEDDEEIVLRGLIGEGDTYGGGSILSNNGISLRSVKTNEDSRLYTLEKDRFLDLCHRVPSFSEYFTDAFGNRMLDKSYAEIIAKSVRPKHDAPAYLSQTVSSICDKTPAFCDYELTIQEAAAHMSQRRRSSIFVQSATGEFVGIVTDNDLREKVVARGVDTAAPVSDIMSTPLYAIPADALVFEALMVMMNKKINHLAVIDDDEKIMGAVTNQDLLGVHGGSPMFLIRQINGAASASELIDKHGQLPLLIHSMISTGAKARNVTRFITTVSDAILNKIIEFALDDLGPAPCRFVFMIMGSEGRKEQTLKTDQDNAIIYEDGFENDKNVRDYFLRLGEKICADLNRAGYAFCEGDVMARNPSWCQSLTIWKQYFTRWIHNVEPEMLLQASIFFDFRGAFGDMGLVDELRGYLFETVNKWSGFFRHLAENALHFKPPIGFFRNFLVESKGENRNTFDIKSAMMPIVDFARIFSLRNQIPETNTLDRLYQLQQKGVLPPAEYNEIEKAYSFLMQLRFSRQVSACMDEHTSPNNHINPKKLSRIEQTTLKEIFKRIEKFQSKLRDEYMGMGY